MSIINVGMSHSYVEIDTGEPIALGRAIRDFVPFDDAQLPLQVLSYLPFVTNSLV